MKSKLMTTHRDPILHEAVIIHLKEKNKQVTQDNKWYLLVQVIITILKYHGWWVINKITIPVEKMHLKLHFN